jgi:hypothetical protein
MEHTIKLSNGQTLTIKEHNQEIGIYQMADGDNWWVCSINNDGVQVSTTCGNATSELVDNLKG